MKRRASKTVRISIGFTDADIVTIEHAMKVCGFKEWSLKASLRSPISDLANRATMALAWALIRQGQFPLPLAVDIRPETSDETDLRAGPAVARKPKQRSPETKTEAAAGRCIEVWIPSEGLSLLDSFAKRFKLPIEVSAGKFMREALTMFAEVVSKTVPRTIRYRQAEGFTDDETVQRGRMQSQVELEANRVSQMEDGE